MLIGLYRLTEYFWRDLVYLSCEWIVVPVMFPAEICNFFTLFNFCVFLFQFVFYFPLIMDNYEEYITNDESEINSCARVKRFTRYPVI